MSGDTPPVGDTPRFEHQKQHDHQAEGERFQGGGQVPIGRMYCPCSARSPPATPASIMAAGPQKEPLKGAQAAHDGHGQIGDGVVQGEGFETRPPGTDRRAGLRPHRQKSRPGQRRTPWSAGVHAHGIGGPVVVPHGHSGSVRSGCAAGCAPNPRKHHDHQKHIVPEQVVILRPTLPVNQKTRPMEMVCP
jgi:hypothetical protein